MLPIKSSSRNKILCLNVVYFLSERRHIIYIKLALEVFAIEMRLSIIGIYSECAISV